MDQCVNLAQPCNRDDGQCPGHADPGVCSFVQALTAWRARTPDQQQAYYASLDGTGPGTGRGTDPIQPGMMAVAPPWSDLAVVEAVRTCPHGGPSRSPLTLSVAERTACGCGDRELYPCAIGRGRVPGRVTSPDCLDCKAAELTV